MKVIDIVLNKGDLVNFVTNILKITVPPKNQLASRTSPASPNVKLIIYTPAVLCNTVTVIKTALSITFTLISEKSTVINVLM